MTYPTIRPELTLDFANSRQLDPRITFSRSSGATYLNPDTGLITLASDHEARFEKEGLLIEASNYNALQHNTQPDNSYYDLSTGLTKTANSAVSPDGNQTALLLTEDSSTGLHVWGKTANVGLTNNVMSLFVKSNGATKVGFRQGGEQGANTRFNLSTGTKISGDGGIEPYSNGWYRIWQIRSGSGNKVFFHLLGDSTELSFQGDGTSGVWVWGFQKEPNIISRPTSLIVTGVGYVTRAADVCTITGDNVTSWYNNAEGTFFYERVKQNTVANQQEFWIYPGPSFSQSNNISPTWKTDPVTQLAIKDANVNQPYSTVSNTADKVAFALKANDTVLAAGGVLGNVVTSNSLPGPIDHINFRYGSWIKRISYYSRRLTNAELETLTL